MSKLNTILKENADLKHKLNDMFGIIHENDVKSKGYRIIEYSFLAANSLAEIEEKALRYVEIIFAIDRVVLFLNKDILSFNKNEVSGNSRIFLTEGKTFNYFFLEKRIYSDTHLVNLISEFSLFSDCSSYMIIPILEGEKIIGSLNFYSLSKDKFDNNVGTDFLKELALKISMGLRKIYYLETLNKKILDDYTENFYNRKALDMILKEKLEKNSPFSFILLRLDIINNILVSYGIKTSGEFIERFEKIVVSTLKKEKVGRLIFDIFYIVTDLTGKDNIEKLIDNILNIFHSVVRNLNLSVHMGINGCVIEGNEIFADELLENDIILEADKRMLCAIKLGKGIIRGLNYDILKK